MSVLLTSPSCLPAILTILNALMACRGYVVSPFGQDGFAILPAQKVLESIQALDPAHGIPGDLEPDV